MVTKWSCIGIKLSLALLFMMTKWAIADPIDAHVANLADILKAGGSPAAQACSDLNTIRGVYGPDKIRPALENMFAGGCSDSLIQSIPLDDDSIFYYMSAVWRGDGGSKRAYSMLLKARNFPPFRDLSANAASFLKVGANCPSSYLVLFLVGHSPSPDTRDAISAVLNMPPCPIQGIPSAAIPTVLVAYQTYDDMRGRAGELLGNNLDDIQAYVDLASNSSVTLRDWAANTAARTLTCDRATHSSSDQNAIDKLVASEINLAELKRNIPIPPGQGAQVYGNLRLLQAIRSCNSSDSATLTTAIQSYAGHPDSGVRSLVGWPTSNSCQCSTGSMNPYL